MRIQTNRAFELGVAFLVAPHRTKAESEPQMRRSITRVQFDRSLKFSFRSIEIVVVPCGSPCERTVTLGKAGIHFEGLQRQSLGFAAALIRRNEIYAKPKETIGEHRV